MTDKCKECPSARDDNYAYCGRCLSHVIETANKWIVRLYPEVHHLYVGRSNYPERRLLQHFAGKSTVDPTKDWSRDRRREYMAVLHWSGSWRETAWVEERLIKLNDGLKVVNDSPESWGNWSGAWNCVYVCWAYKQSATPVAFAETHPLEHLDWPIVEPALDQWRREPTVLKVSRSISDETKAAALLTRLTERRRTFAAEFKSWRSRRA